MELTVYPDGHAGISVSEIEGSPPSRRIVQRDTLPLNDLDEPREHILAVVEHLAHSVGVSEPSPPSRTQERTWRIGDLERDLDQFERELRDAGLAENSVETYVGRTTYFLRWLKGEYTPRVT